MNFDRPSIHNSRFDSYSPMHRATEDAIWKYIKQKMPNITRDDVQLFIMDGISKTPSRMTSEQADIDAAAIANWIVERIKNPPKRMLLPCVLPRMAFPESTTNIHNELGSRYR